MLTEIVRTYLILINAAGFVLMLADKRKAIRHVWRIPERTLLGVAICGGSLGSLAGMYLLRHKTRHLKFALGLPLIFAAHFVLLLFIASRI